MTLEECPVSVNELKMQLRQPVDVDLDSNLEMCLLGGAEFIEDYCGRKFHSFEEGTFPNQLKQAILRKAASLFENPTDGVDERTTASMKLANPRKWKETTN